MKLFITILSVLMVVMGVVWILQGFNILPGSFMTGDRQWALRGALLAVAGLALAAWTRRKRA